MSFQTDLKLSSNKYSNCIHRGISRLQAEEILKNSKIDGSFLVRESETIQNGYTLCVLCDQKICQYRILPDNHGQLSVESEEGVKNKKYSELTTLISEYVDRGATNGLVTALTNPIMVVTEVCSDDELECEADDVDTGATFERSTTPRRTTVCLKSKNFDMFIQQYFLQRFNHVVASSSIGSCDDEFKDSMKDYVMNGAIKDVYLNESLNVNNNINNSINTNLNNNISNIINPKVLHLQACIEEQAQQLIIQVESFLKKIDLWRQLFGPMTTSPLYDQSNDASKLSLKDLLDKMASCKTAIANLEKKASVKYMELINMWKEGEIVVADIENSSTTTSTMTTTITTNAVVSSTTPSIQTSTTFFPSSSSTQLNKPIIPLTSFDIRTVTSIGSLSKLLLTVDMMNGKLFAVKPSKDALSDKNIIPHDKIEQLVKSTSCNTRLDMYFVGTKKRTYVFEDARQRETFCQLIQQLKRKHSSEVDVNYVSIFIGSWNMGSEIPLYCLQPWLRSDGLGKKRNKTLGMIGHDIYVIGTQESSLSDKEWSTRVLSLLVESFGEEYYVVTTATLWSIRTMIIAKTKHKKKISNVQQSAVRTGIANTLGNKGAVGVSMHLAGTSFCFINAHLTSGGEKIKRRNDNFRDIIRFLDMGARNCKDVTNKFHHVFFFGDLNYRLDHLDSQTIVDSIQSSEGNYQQLLQHDQLNQCIANNEVFVEFKEGEILFPPTYRFQKGSRDCYVWEKKKATGVRINVPSWCDRVLWKSYPNLWINNTSYGSCDHMCSSDHKPIFASFDVKINNMGSTFTLNNSTGQLIVSIHDVTVQLKTSRPENLRIEITSTCIEGSICSKYSLSTMENDTTACCQWLPDQIPLLHPIIDDLDLLEEQHLLVSVQNEALELFGECVLALKSCYDNTPQSLTTQLVHLGQWMGLFKCSIQIQLKDPKNQQTFNKRKPSADLIYIDADFLQQHFNNNLMTTIYQDVHFTPINTPTPTQTPMYTSVIKPNKPFVNFNQSNNNHVTSKQKLGDENKIKPEIPPRIKKTTGNESPNANKFSKQPAVPVETGVNKWLCDLKMEEYLTMFLDNGWDNLKFISIMDNCDLVKIGVVNATHRQTILKSIQNSFSI